MTEENKKEVIKEKTFQHYKCSRTSTKVITEKGRLIKFTAGQYITDNEEEIEYLDAQLKINGLRGITKEEAMTSADADPMVALKRKIIADYLAKEAKENAAPADMGKTEKTSVKPVGTDKLQELLANSNAKA